MTYRLNIRKIIDFCCGLPQPESRTQIEKIEALVKELNKAKLCKIKVNSVKKWLERDSLPADQIVHLHILSLRQGKRLVLHEFIEGLSDEDLFTLLG